MPFKVLVVTQAMMLVGGGDLLTFLTSQVKLTCENPFATNQLDFLQVTQINQQVTAPHHLSCHGAQSSVAPACHSLATRNARTT